MKKKSFLLSFVLLRSFLLLGGCSLKKTPTVEAVPSVVSWTDIESDAGMTREALRSMSEPSTVMIWTTRQQNSATRPTEFAIDEINWLGRWISVEEGKALTVAHLFTDPDAYYVLLNGKDGSITSIDNIWKHSNDLALVWVATELVPYKLIAARPNSTIGEQVLADDGYTYYGKIIEYSGGQIVTTLELTPGKSWLPLFNDKWVLIWINSSITEKDGSTVTYAQSITKPFLEELLSWGN